VPIAASALRVSVSAAAFADGVTRRDQMSGVCQGSTVPAFPFLCPLRWSDTDAYGHINNVELMRLLEEARVALLFTRATAVGVRSFEGHVVVARHEVDFTAPLLWRPEPVQIDTRVAHVGGASFTLAYTVAEPTGPEQSYVRATTVMVTFDPELRRTRRLTEAERRFLDDYTDPAAPGPQPSSGEQPGAAVGGQGTR
jgi:acyl-CoA thioester hydrolase